MLGFFLSITIYILGVKYPFCEGLRGAGQYNQLAQMENLHW
jgi:hypothetical protein